jgi:two-component system chemotaxis sensor kinase CheA
MASGNVALLNEFVSEAREHLAGVGEDLLALEKGGADEWQPRLDRLFRAMHSVKGGASLVACGKIASLAHALETLLDRLRSGQLTLRPGVMDGLLASVDLLHTLLDDVGGSDQVDISAALKRLEDLLQEPAVPAEKPGGGEPASVFRERPGDHAFVSTIRVELGAYLRRTGRAPLSFLTLLQEHGCILDARLHVPDQDLALGLPDGPVEYECDFSSAMPPDQVAAHFQLSAGEWRVSSEQPPAAVPAGEPGAISPRQESGSGGAGLLTRPDGSGEPSYGSHLPAGGIVPEGPAPGANAPGAAEPAPADKPSTVRIGVQVLDRLMTLAGELVLVRNQALRAVEPPDPLMLRQVVQRLNAVTTDVQQAVMLTRMQPVSTLFGKFPRLVRDLAKQLGKQIELTLAGTEVELDKTILEALSDPLTHLVRNCCDHGIETPAERLAAGKPPEGHIVLHAHHEGGQIRIDVRDDGRGIDPRKVRRKALERGLKTAAELAALGDDEVQALILAPGFSTAERVTDLSGRGIGMDVVRTNVEQLRGNLQIESTPGAGTCVHLRLPLTLAIIPCLVVMAGAERYCIPQKDLEELVYLGGGQAGGNVEYAYDQEVYRLRQRLLPLVRLPEVLASPAPFTAATRARKLRTGNGAPQPSVCFAVVKVGSQRFGLVVDQLLDTEEIVVKPMHPVLKPLRCFSGATIMGDGRVALILDVEGIARHAGVFSGGARPPAPAAAEDQAERQTILLFQYGPREQFAVALAMVRRIEEIRAAAIERVGDREYVTVKGRPVRVLRLDRFLDVSPGPEQETMYLLLPRHLKQPAGILMSRIVDTDNLAIQLDTRIYRADGVLGTALVRDRLTLFLDLFRLGDRLAADEKEPEVPRKEPDRRRRILLVEDTAFFRQLVKGYLEGEGYEVVTAANGLLGLNELAAGPFDLVVSDIEMPEMDGWRLARAVREQSGHRGLPLLALTTLNSDSDRRRALECGFDGYEVKIDRERFLASVARLLGEGRDGGGPSHD